MTLAWTDCTADFRGVVLAASSAVAVRVGRLKSCLQEPRTQLTSALERIRALATRDDLTGLETAAPQSGRRTMLPGH